jgi:hypothetical protein
VVKLDLHTALSAIFSAVLGSNEIFGGSEKKKGKKELKHAKSAKKDCCWMTFVGFDGNCNGYASAAAVFAKSVRNVNSKYEVWCLLSDGASDECEKFLSHHFDGVVRVPIIKKEIMYHPARNAEFMLKYGNWQERGFTRLQAFNPDIAPAEKIAMFDADSIMIQNMDEIFELEGPAMVMETYKMANNKKRWSEGKDATDSNNIQHKVIFSKDKVMSMVSHTGFWGGLVIYRPSKELYKTFQRQMEHEKIGFLHPRCPSGIDEQMYVKCFLDTYNQIQNIKYNYSWVFGRYFYVQHDTPYSIQYMAMHPWEYEDNMTEWPDTALWFALWNKWFEDVDANAIKWREHTPIPDEDLERRVSPDDVKHKAYKDWIQFCQKTEINIVEKNSNKTSKILMSNTEWFKIFKDFCIKRGLESYFNT